MSLVSKLAKTGAKGVSSVIGDKSTWLSEKAETIPTQLPVLNIALSGELKGGISPGVTIYAGESATGKTILSWITAKAFQTKYEDGVVVFYDSEFGTTKEYLESIGIDNNRVIHVPVTDIEQLNFDIMAKLDAIEDDERVFFLVDSLGNIASKKEVEDALGEKSAQDMTRAKKMKALFRQITPIIAKKKLYFVGIAHTYETQEMFSKQIVGGGCIIAGTKVIMADGNLKNIEDIQVGDYVKTLNGISEVINTWKPDTLFNGYPEIYEIEFEDGSVVKCSPEHKFLINGIWVSAKDIKEGDDVKCIFD